MTDKKHSQDTQHDVNTKAIFWFGIGLLVLVLISFLAMAVLFKYFEGREKNVSASSGRVEMTEGPPLQSTPQADLKQVRAEEEKILSSYGWVNKQEGVVRIPIERAMELTVERGLPTEENNI